jgi:uncharacterized protein
MRVRPSVLLVFLVLLVLGALIAVNVRLVALLNTPAPRPIPRLDDRVGLIPPSARGRFDYYLDQVRNESGIDIRIVLVPDSRGRPSEEFALGLMRELGVGRETGGRGLLIVYDTLARVMRIEVGPKLQGVLPDAFVGYLMRENVDAFFGVGQAELGLRTTLFMIHWRIRMARLGEEYNPSFQEYVRDVRRLSSGGGASRRLGLDRGLAPLINRTSDSAAAAHFRPQPSVEAAYRSHMEWLALGGGQVDVPLFTPASQAYFRGLPLSPALNAYLLATVYGRRYRIDQRGDLAMLYYTDDPFLSPKFFRRTPEGWQMDVVAEVANSQETVGFYWTWQLRVSGDDFSRVFADRYAAMPIPGTDDYYRVAGGDNRALTVRGTAIPVDSELDSTASPGLTAYGAEPGVEWLTVREAAERVRSVRGRPAVVVVYETWSKQSQREFPEIVRLARLCRERGVALLAFEQEANPVTVEELSDFLHRHDAPFAPVVLYPWRPGLFGETMAELGIEVGGTWMPPLVAFLDREGRVVWQAEGVRDWATVAAAIEGDAR